MQNPGYYREYEGQGGPGYVVGPQPMVVQQQPSRALDIDTEFSFLAQPTGGREWSSGIFDCFNDITSCCLTTFFAECYVCYLSGKMGEGCFAPLGMGPNVLIPMRQKVRLAGDIEGSMLMDCCCSTFCALCVVCQMKREMDFISGKR